MSVDVRSDESMGTTTGTARRDAKVLRLVRYRVKDKDQDVRPRQSTGRPACPAADWGKIRRWRVAVHGCSV
jgi:hypothetical protein